MNNSQHKHGIYFGFITAFLTGLALTIISPVIPFLVERYTTNSSTQATVVTLLMSVYALATFISAPILGSLSDYYGRRPVLIISLIGSAIGYLIFGLGGSLWVLFLGRIIEGVSGGEIATIFAYFSDITSKEERTKYFGWLSAVVGIGTAFGPLLGGLLAHFGPSMPMYFGAGITLINAIYGYFLMPESIAKRDNQLKIEKVQINPINQIKFTLMIPTIKWFLLVGSFIWLANGSFQAIFSQLTIDLFSWQPALIGMSFSMIGFVDIFSQFLIMPQLIKRFSDKIICLIGITGEVSGYIFITASVIFKNPLLFLVGLFIFSFGDAIFTPAFNGFISKSVSSKEQGRLQGTSQSVQSLARVIGPIVGGQIYVFLTPAAPAIMSVLFIGLSGFLLFKKLS